MRARWTPRRAWTVWLFASLLSWIAIGALFFALLSNDADDLADETGANTPVPIAPAAGPGTSPSR